MRLDIVVKSIKPIRAVTLCGTDPSHDAMDDVTPAILAAITKNGVELAGEPIGIYYGEEFRTRACTVSAPSGQNVE